MRLRILLFALLGLVLLATTTRPARAQRQDQVIACSSDDGHRHYCQADTRGGVSLGRQHSGDPCIQGSTWGYDERGIWVDRGCRADFVLSGEHHDGFFGHDGDRDRRDNARTITCSSDDGHRHHCAADTSRGVQLVKQRSGDACIEGRTWGYDRESIWVDRGCRADFAVR
jgi:Protein of unknown function (DUF3011)